MKSDGCRYKRVVLKISGEAIGGVDGAFDLDAVRRISNEIKKISGLGCETGVVIGGGNIVRGSRLSGQGLDRSRSDYMGMLATVINGVLFENTLKAIGVDAVLQSALHLDVLTEPIDLKRTEKYLKAGSVVIFSGGTGNPYFTTDTAAALRACEIGADALLKATKVDGVYDRDPATDEKAVFFPSITYQEVIGRNLKVMDAAAVTMCRDSGIPIIIFNLYRDGNIEKIVKGYDIGTSIKE
ncbi:MAG: UMP kinase [Spirochaetes bacterium]|nr:UMP kinase [Spirochaetota bacterium]